MQSHSELVLTNMPEEVRELLGYGGNADHYKGTGQEQDAERRTVRWLERGAQVHPSLLAKCDPERWAELAQ